MADDESRWLSISEPVKMENVRVWAGDNWALDDVVDFFVAGVEWLHEQMDVTTQMEKATNEGSRSLLYDAKDESDQKLYSLIYGMIYEDKRREE